MTEEAAANAIDEGIDVPDDDDFAYENIDIEEELDEALAELKDENKAASVAAGVDSFDTLNRTVQRTKERDAPPQVRADLTRLPEVVDDFVRNFFVKRGLLRTLDTFEIEWYEKYGSNPEENVQMVPDVYLENAQLVDRVANLERELAKHKSISRKATTLWEHVKKERDLHRMNHNRVIQEKSKVSRDLKRLQSHAQTIEPTVAELRQKYESSQKDKMLLRLERDKLAARIKALEDNVRELEGQPKDQNKVESSTKEETSRGTWPLDSRPNPFAATAPKAPSNAAGWSCRSSFKAHAMSVTHVAIHPKKPVVASSSDDGTWRLSSLPQGELIMSGGRSQGLGLGHHDAPEGYDGGNSIRRQDREAVGFRYPTRALQLSKDTPRGCGVLSFKILAIYWHREASITRAVCGTSQWGNASRRCGAMWTQ